LSLENPGEYIYKKKKKKKHAKQEKKPQKTQQKAGVGHCDKLRTKTITAWKGDDKDSLLEWRMRKGYGETRKGEHTGE